MGLSVSHSLVKQLGGELSLEDDSASGACFSVVIPLKPAEEQ